MLCAFNLGEAPLDWTNDIPGSWSVAHAINGATTDQLPPFAAIFLRDTPSPQD
jgi:hypothetical protein